MRLSSTSCVLCKIAAFSVHNVNCPLGHMDNFARISFSELLYASVFIFFFAFNSVNFIFFLHSIAKFFLLLLLISCNENWFFRKSVHAVCKSKTNKHTTPHHARLFSRQKKRRKKSSDSMSYAMQQLVWSETTETLVTHD